MVVINPPYNFLNMVCGGYPTQSIRRSLDQKVAKYECITLMSSYEIYTTFWISLRFFSQKFTSLEVTNELHLRNLASPRPPNETDEVSAENSLFRIPRTRIDDSVMGAGRLAELSGA
jgi:hypothetical protein